MFKGERWVAVHRKGFASIKKRPKRRTVTPGKIRPTQFVGKCTEPSVARSLVKRVVALYERSSSHKPLVLGKRNKGVNVVAKMIKRKRGVMRNLRELKVRRARKHRRKYRTRIVRKQKNKRASRRLFEGLKKRVLRIMAKRMDVFDDGNLFSKKRRMAQSLTCVANIVDRNAIFARNNTNNVRMTSKFREWYAKRGRSKSLGDLELSCSIRTRKTKSVREAIAFKHSGKHIKLPGVTMNINKRRMHSKTIIARAN